MNNPFRKQPQTQVERLLGRQNYQLSYGFTSSHFSHPDIFLLVPSLVMLLSPFRTYSDCRTPASYRCEISVIVWDALHIFDLFNSAFPPWLFPLSEVLGNFPHLSAPPLCP